MGVAIMKATEQTIKAQNGVFSQYGASTDKDGNRNGQQIRDVGKTVTKSDKVNKKSLKLINYMLKETVGKTYSFKRLENELWQKWEGATYSTKDILTDTDITTAIKQMWRMINENELQFADGKKKMLVEIRDGHDTRCLKLTEFVEDYFTVVEPKKPNSKMSSVKETLEELAKRDNLTDAEKKALECALKKLA